MRKLIFLLLLVLMPLVSGATQWVIDPNSCNSLDGTNFPGQDCTPEDICGEDSGIAKCYDTSTITAPAANTTTYSTNNLADNDGGYSLDCYIPVATSAPYCFNDGLACERNETFHGSPANRNTVCLGTTSGGTFGDTEIGICKTEGTDYWDCFGDNNCESTSSSVCDGSANNHYITATCNTGPEGGASGTCVCDTNRFACDGSITDGDGCEIGAGSSCGDSTGTIVLDQCFDASNGNCTRSSDYLDCDDDDSDLNEITCNGANGCEINPFTDTNNSQSTYTNCSSFQCVNNGTLNGWLDCNQSGDDPWGGSGLDSDGCEVQNNSVCTVGGLSGTVNMCSGGGANCLVDDQDIATTGIEVIWSGVNPMLWLRQLGSGIGLNISFPGADFTVNSSGAYWNYTLLGSGGGGGADGNASSICSTDEALLGNNTCMSSSLFFDDTTIADTNATTECSTDEVLLGNSSCMSSSLFGTGGGFDGNASSICSTIEVLLGNNTCMSTALFFDDTTISDTNFSTECSVGEYGDGGSYCLNFNTTVEQITASVTYFPSTMNVTAGTLDVGNYTDLWDSKDGNTVNVSEAGGTAPVLTIIINFTGVEDFNSMTLREHYEGGLGHEIIIGLYDFAEGNYEEEYGEITDMAGFAFTKINVLDADDHINGGNVSLRLNHEQNGINSHNFFLDYAVLVDGFSTITTTEHDSLSGRDDIENHPWAMDKNASRNFTFNVLGDFGVNATFNWFFGLFDWVINPNSQSYLSFNGSTLELNQTLINITIDQRINSSAIINYTNIVLSNQTNPSVNITVIQGVQNITESATNNINIIPGDVDDYLSFEMESGQPVIKRIGGSSIYFKSDSATEVFWAIREDSTHRVNLVWDKTLDYFYIDSTSWITLKDFTNIEKSLNVTSNITVNERLCLNSVCSRYMWDNGTATIIKG